jgi:hypothetical protein
MILTIHSSSFTNIEASLYKFPQFVATTVIGPAQKVTLLCQEQPIVVLNSENTIALVHKR